MPGLLDKIAALTDEQLLEGGELLNSANTDDLRFVREAMAMEYERRHGEDDEDQEKSATVADELWLRFNPFHDRLGRFATGPGDGVYRTIQDHNIVAERRISEENVNSAYYVEHKDKDGTVRRGAFKPIDEENPQVHPAFSGRQTTNEEAASIIDEEMNLGMVAKAEMVTLHGKRGVMTEWINDDAKLAVHLPDATLANARGMSDMLHYDALTGNADRHLKNWLVKDGAVRLIDNGMSMARNSDYDNFSLRFRTMEHAKQTRAFQPMSPKFKEGLANILVNRQRVDARLRKSGVDEERRASFWKRADYLHRQGRIGFGNDTLRELARLSEGLHLFGWE